MIQALNSVNSNYRNTKSAQTFGHQHTPICYNDGCFYEAQFGKPKSKAKKVAGFIGREFVTGALVSATIDGLCNGWAAIKKNPAAMLNAKQIAARAGFWGVAWIAMGTVIGLVSNATRPRY